MFPHCACAAVCPPFTPGAEQLLPPRHAPKTHEYRIPEPVHCAQGNLNTIKRCLLTNYSPSSPDPDFRDCIQVVLRTSWGMTKRLQQTFPRQELTVGHRWALALFWALGQSWFVSTVTQAPRGVARCCCDWACDNLHLTQEGVREGNVLSCGFTPKTDGIPGQPGSQEGEAAAQGPEGGPAGPELPEQVGTVRGLLEEGSGI